MFHSFNQNDCEVKMRTVTEKLNLPNYILDILNNSKGVTVPRTREELIELAMGNGNNTTFDVCYDVPGRGNVKEATVVKLSLIHI